MALPGIVDGWNYWTDSCDPQEFMHLSRAQGHSTIGSAVDAYVVAIPGLDRAWAGLNAEELEEIRDLLMSYLFLTRGVDWRSWPDTTDPSDVACCAWGAVNGAP